MKQDVTKYAKYLTPSNPKAIDEQFVQECQHFKMYTKVVEKTRPNSSYIKKKQVGKYLFKFGNKKGGGKRFERNKREQTICHYPFLVAAGFHVWDTQTLEVDSEKLLKEHKKRKGKQ
ncbi:UNVERIFIED_CONTAM: hypothetical protein NCL1_30089 [Trichonephila clavipes]